MLFENIFRDLDWSAMKTLIYDSSIADVKRALAEPKLTISGFATLISPAAKPYIEQMAQISRATTQKRFGNTMQMYAPLYLSNECQNICTYCGFKINEF